MKNNKSTSLVSLLLVVISIYAAANKNPDSLALRTYDDLESKATNKKLDKTKNLTYARAWLAKAKADHNWVELAKSYKTLMYLEEKKDLLPYADSLLYVSKKTNEGTTIGKAYLTKGIVHYDRKEMDKALDNYLVAYKYIVATKEDYTLHKLKYAIAQTKLYLGFYNEALALFKECLTYFQEESDQGYLNTLHALGLCYNKLGSFTTCSYYNALGIKKASEWDIPQMDIYFKHSEAINQYSKQNYKAAIEQFSQIIPQLQEKGDFANEDLANFYLGKCHWALQQIEQAIPYFIAVDKSFTIHKYSRPDLRENYELLIKWYQQKKDLQTQITYINRLLEMDQLLNQKYKYLSKKIFKEYDTKKLIAEKQKVERALKAKNNCFYLIVTFLSTAIIFLAFRHYKNKKHYKKKFEEIMNSNTNTIKKNGPNNNNEALDINTEVIDMVLKNLEKFEKNKKYLEKDMNLIRIATLLNTNTKYASKIIYKYRGKKTIDYISDLKIEHIVNLLKNENKYKNYTNKALGEEAGFGSTQNFTRAFKNKTEISPTYFIQKLKDKK